MVQWNALSPQFSRGITAAMSNAMAGISAPGQFAENTLNRLAKDEAEATRIAERKEDTDFRQAQADRQAEQWKLGHALQQATANREAEKFGIDKATTQAVNQSLVGLDSISQEGLTQDQSNKVLAVFNKSGTKAAEAEYAKQLAAYKASPVLQKQLVSQYNLSGGPVEMQVGTDANGAPIMQTVTPDLSKAQVEKTRILTGLDRQIADDKKLAAEWDMVKFKAKQDEKLANIKGDKFQPYTVTVGFDSTGKPTSDPSKIAYKSQINVNSPRMEQAVSQGYGMQNIQLGNVTDFIPNKTDKGKGGKIFSSSNYKALSEQYGTGDASRILDTATVVKQRNPWLSDDQAIGLVRTQVDANTFSDSVDVSNLNEIGLRTYGNKYQNVYKK